MPAIGGMASGMGGNIGSAWITVGANTSQLVSGMGAATTSMKTFGKAALTLYAVIAAVKTTTSAFVEFDRQLKNTSTLVDYSTKKMDGIGNSVREMARQYQVGSAEAQEALYHIYSATIYGASAMDVLTESAKGAAAGLASLGAVGDMLTTVVNAYGMAASRAAEINDYLFTTIKYGKVTMAELAGNFGRLAGVAAPVGASISEMSAAIATLTRQGIRTDWAITSLRQTLMQFIKPVKNLDEAITAMGYSSGTAIIRQEGFAGALKLVTKWAKENNVEMSEMFTNVRAITAVLPLTTTAAAGYAMDLARMANSTGAATEAFVKQTKSMSFQLEKLGSLVKDTAISIGKVLVPALQILMTVITGLANVLREVFEAISKLGGDWVIAAAASIGILIASVKGLTLALAKLGLTAASVATGTWISGITTALTRMFRVIGANSLLFGRFVKDVGTPFASGGAIGTFTKGAYSTSAMISGMATAALGIGAAALTVKQIVKIDPEFIIEQGNVRAAHDTFWKNIGAVITGAASGFVMSGFNPLGAVAGGLVAGVSVVMKIQHEVNVKQAGLDAPRIEELKARFFAEFDFPDTIPGMGIVSDFLLQFSNVPAGASSEIADALGKIYDINVWRALTNETGALSDNALVLKNVFGDLSAGLAANADEIVSSAEDAYRASKIREVTGGLMPTDSELLSMSDADMAKWGQDLRNIMNDTIDPTVISDWMASVLQASVDNSIDSLNRREGIDTAALAAAITASLEMPQGSKAEIEARRDELASSIGGLLSDAIPSDEIFAFVERNFKGLEDGAKATLLEGLGKGIEEFEAWKVSSATTDAVRQKMIEGLQPFYDALSSIDPTLSKINKEFFDLWDTLEDTPVGETAAVWDNLSGVITKWRKEIDALARSGKITADKAEELNNAIDALDGVLGNTDDSASAAAAAIRDFNLALEGLDPSKFVDGFKSAIAELEASYLSAGNPMVSDSVAQALLGVGSSVEDAMARAERIFTDESKSTEMRNKAYRDWEQLGKIGYAAGKTLAEIADDELKRLNEEKAVSDEIAAKQKEAADAAKQAAEDAAAAAQEAFRGIFKEPMLEGVRSGDWQSAAETIVGFARASRDIMDFASNLSSANGEIIDEIEVLELVTGSLGDLQSTVDSMIQMGIIAGEDTLALRVFKNSLEDLQDPIAGLAAKIREILRIDVPENKGAELRKIILAAYGMSDPRGFASGGVVPGVGSGDKIPAMLEPGEFVIPNWMMNLPGMKDVISRIYNKKFAAGGYVDPSDMRGIAGIAGLPDNSLLGSAPFGVNVTMPSVPTQPPYSDNSFVPAITKNTTSIVAAIKTATLTITNSFSSIISSGMFTDPGFSNSGMSMPSFTSELPAGGPGITLPGFTSDESLARYSPQPQELTTQAIDRTTDIQGEIDKVLSEVRDAFNEAAETSIDAAAMSAQAVDSAVSAVEAFAKTLGSSDTTVAELATTIDDLWEKIKSGTLTAEEEQEARKDLQTVIDDAYATYKNEIAAVEEQIKLFNDMGLSTTALENELLMLEAGFKKISGATLKWQNLIEGLDRGTGALMENLLTSSPEPSKFQNFLSSQESGDVQAGVNQLVGYTGEVGSALFKLAGSLASGNVIGAIMAAVDILVMAFKFVGDAMQEVKDIALETFNGIKDAAIDVWGKIVSVSKIAQNVATGAFDLMKGAAKSLWGAVSGISGAIKNVAVRSFELMADSAKFLWSNVVDFSKTVKDAAIKAFGLISDSAKYLWGSVQSIAGAVKKVTIRAFDLMLDSSKFLLGAMKGIADVIKRVAVSAFGLIADAAKSLWSTTLNVANSINKVAVKAFGLMLDSAKYLWGSIQSVAGSIKKVAIGAFDLMLDSAKSLWKGISGISKAIGTAMSSIFGSMRDIATNVFGEISSVAKSLTSSFINLIQSTESYTEVQSALATIQDKVFGMMMGFLAPIAAVLNAFIGSIDSASESMQSLNVPTGYKVERSAWKAATPGEPGDKTDSDGMPSWLSGIMDGFIEAIDAAAEKFLEFADILGEVWGQLAGVTIPVVISALSELGDDLLALGNHILNDLLPIFTEYMPGVIEGALDFFSGAIIGISTSFVDVLAGILPNLNLFMVAVGDIGKKLPELLASLTGAIIPAINDLLENAIIPLANRIVNDLIPVLTEHLPGVISGAIDFFGNAVVGVASLFAATLTGILPNLELLAQALGGIGSGLPDIFSGIADAIIPAMNRLLEEAIIPLANRIINDLIPVLTENLPGVISGVIEFFGGAITGIATLFIDVLSGILPNLEAFSRALGGIGAGFPDMFSGVADEVVLALNRLLEDAIIPLTERITNDLIPVLTEHLPGVVSGAVDFFGGAIAGVATLFVDVLEGIIPSLDLFMQSVGAIGQELPNIFGGLGDSVTPAINNLIENALIPLADSILNDLIPVLGEYLPDTIANAIDFFGNAIIGAANLFADVLSGVLPNIALFSDSLSSLGEQLPAFYDAISAPIISAINTLLETAIIPLANNITNNLIPVLTEELPGIISGAASLLSAVLGGVGNLLTSTFTDILPSLSEFVETLGSASGQISELFTSLSDSLSSAINFLIEDSLIPLAEKIAGELIPVLTESFPSIINGAATFFAGAVGGIANLFVDTITDILPNLALFSDSIGEIGLQLPEFFSAISDSLSASINFLIEDGLIPLANNIANDLIPALTENLPAIIGGAADFFAGAVGGIANLFVDTLTNILPSLALFSESVGNIGTQLPELFSALSDSLSASINFLIDGSLIPLAEKIANNLIPVLTEYLPTIIGGAADFFAGAVGGIANLFVGTLTDVLPNIALFSESLGAIGQQLPEFFDAISEAIGATINNLLENGIIPLMDKIATQLIPALTEYLPSVINGAADFFFGAVSGIANLFVDTLTNVLPNIALFSDSISAIGLQLPEFFSAMTDAISSSINSLLENGLIPLTENIANNLIPALTEYLPTVIEGAADFFFGAVSGIANLFVETLTNVLPNIALFSESLSAIGLQLPEFFAAMADSMSSSINFLLEDGLIPLTDNIANNLIPMLTEYLPTIIKGAADFFFGAVSGIANLFVDTLTNVLPNIALFSESLSNLGLQLPEFFAAMTGAISSSINSLLENGLIPLTDNIANNLIPALTEYLPAIIKGAADFFFGAVSGIANLFVETLTNVLPNIALFSESLSAVGLQLPEFFMAMADSITSSINFLLEDGLIPLTNNIANNLIPALTEYLPSVIKGAADFFFGAISGIANLFVDTLTNTLPNIALFSENISAIGLQLPEFFAAMTESISDSINFLLEDGLIPLTENIANNLIPALTEYLPTVIEGAADFFFGAISGIANLFVATLTNVLPNIALFSESLSEIGKQLPEFFAAMSESVSYSINALLENALIPLANNISNNLIPVLTEYLPSIITGAADFFSNAIGGIANMFVTTITNVLPSVVSFSESLSAVGMQLPEFFDAMADGVSNAINFLINDGLIPLTNNIATNLIPALTEYLPGIVEGAANFFSGAITGIANGFVTTLTNVLPNISLFSDNLNAIGKQLPAFFNSMAAAISPVINTLLQGAFIPLSNFVSNTLLPDLQNFFSEFGKWWSSDMDPFLQSNVFPTLGKWLKNLYDWIGGTLLPFLSGPFFNAFKNDIWPVIKSAVDQLGGALGDLGNTLAKNMPAITEFVTTYIENLTKKWTGMVEKTEALVLTKSGKLFEGLEVIWDSKSLTLWDKVKTSIGLGAIALWDEIVDAFRPVREALGRVGKALGDLWDVIGPLVTLILGIIGEFLGMGFKMAIHVVTVAIEALAIAVNAITWIFKMIGNLVIGLINSVIAILNLIPFVNIKQIPYLEDGGTVLSTGMAVVHKGEVVAPAGTAPLNNYGSSGTVIDNTIMLDGNVLYRGMKKVNRQEQLRRTGSSIGGRAWQGS